MTHRLHVLRCLDNRLHGERDVMRAGSLAWGMIVDKFRPDRWDMIGAVICVAGVAVIMYAPRT